MSEPTPDDPPPDGGPLLFAASFLALPALLGALYAWSFVGRPRGALRPLSISLAMFAIGGLWVYFARARLGLVGRATLVGLGVGAALAWMASAEMHVAGDDVLPLLMIFVGPVLLVAGALVGAISGGVTLLAFAHRQYARSAWLARVVAGGNPRYSIVALPPAAARKPAFLRYRDGDVGLLLLATAEYRDPPGAEVIARVSLPR